MADSTVLTRLGAMLYGPPLSGRGYVRATVGEGRKHGRRAKRARGSGPRSTYGMNGERAMTRRRRQIAAGTLKWTKE